VSVIEFQGLTKRFGTTLAVDNLSFEVEKGHVTGFLGPNGAGKTTTLRSLLGLVTPTSGKATINGKAYRDLANPTRQVGALLEASSYHPARSARNHLKVLAAVENLPDSRVDEVLALVGLFDVRNKKVKGFSLGMRQRLGLAAALLGDPEVLVLDEPANGLDPEGIRWMRDLLRRLAASGRTILVSSHVLSEVAQTVDRVIIVGRGRLLANNTLEELTGAAASTVRVRSPQADRLAGALAQAGIAVEPSGPGTLSVKGVPTEAIGDLAAQAGVVLHELTTERSNLERIFFELTEGTAQHAAGQAQPSQVPQWAANWNNDPTASGGRR
jgi:ABC-2 type transport system ATP-binding protein